MPPCLPWPRPPVSLATLVPPPCLSSDDDESWPVSDCTTVWPVVSAAVPLCDGFSTELELVDSSESKVKPFY